MDKETNTIRLDNDNNKVYIELQNNISIEVKLSGESKPLGFIIDVFFKKEGEDELFDSNTYWFDDFE